MTPHTNHACSTVPAVDLPRLVGLPRVIVNLPPHESLLEPYPPGVVEQVGKALADVMRPVVDAYSRAFAIVGDAFRAEAARLRLEAAWGPRRTADARPWTPPALLGDELAPARHSSVAGLASFGGAR